MNIKVSIEDHGIGAALDALGADMSDAVGSATSDALHMVESAAKTNAPKRTGRLAGSIRVTGPGGGGGGWTGKVGPHVVYANIQEFGGVITPHGHPFLAFNWPGAPAGMRRLPDGRVLARHVTIPAHPYMRPAVGEVRPQVVPLYEAALAKVIEE